MERGEIERAVESLVALSRAGKADREAVARLLAERFLAIADDVERMERSHSLVRLMLDLIPVLARVRHLAVVALRASDRRRAPKDRRWSYASLGERLDVDRASAQTIARREGVRLPFED